ncbi:MAG: peptidoglycan-binding protein [Clostridia bacterium]|nr:peptidoglycan-binding protein [Clostridia bacterium]
MRQNHHTDRKGFAARNKRIRRAALAALALCLLCAATAGLIHGNIPARIAPESANDTAARSPEAAQASDAADAAPTSTAAPVTTATPKPTAQPTPEPESEAVPEPAKLPVYYRGDAGAKRIAITVDDCYQVANLRRIVSYAEAAGGRLTLFPVGENLSKPGMPALLRRCAFELGYEIENHTYSHARIFRLPEEEMAGEIWRQSAALNRALNADYRQHFLRLMGGDGETDLRIHDYLDQLGYRGIAKWSVSGSDSDLAQIKRKLAPGQIYLFHTTDGDTAKLRAFIPWAVAQGYELVTMNALLGLPENEVSPLSERTMPAPRTCAGDDHTLKVGEYTWTALRLQDRLRKLGYLTMSGPSTGYYGARTAAAVAAYQRSRGLKATGRADAATQRLLLGRT